MHDVIIFMITQRNWVYRVFDCRYVMTFKFKVNFNKVSLKVVPSTQDTHYGIDTCIEYIARLIVSGRKRKLYYSYLIFTPKGNWKCYYHSFSIYLFWKQIKKINNWIFIKLKCFFMTKEIIHWRDELQNSRK